MSRSFRVGASYVGTGVDGSWCRAPLGTTERLAATLLTPPYGRYDADDAEADWLAGVAFMEEIASGANPQNMRRLIQATSGLVAYWPLDDAAGSASAAELQGLYPGTPAGGWVFGNAGLLREAGDSSGAGDGGSGTGIDIGGTVAPLGFPDTGGSRLPFSVEAWVENTGTLLSTRTIINALNSGTSGTSGGWRLQVGSSGQVLFGRVDVTFTATNAVTANGVIAASAPGVVYYVAGTFDGNDGRVYVNGALAAGPTANTRVLPALTVAPRIGRLAYTTGNAWQGRIGHLAIYSRALAAAEISRRYQLGAGLAA